MSDELPSPAETDAAASPAEPEGPKETITEVVGTFKDVDVLKVSGCVAGQPGGAVRDQPQHPELGAQTPAQPPSSEAPRCEWEEGMGALAATGTVQNHLQPRNRDLAHPERARLLLNADKEQHTTNRPRHQNEGPEGNPATSESIGDPARGRARKGTDQRSEKDELQRVDLRELGLSK